MMLRPRSCTKGTALLAVGVVLGWVMASGGRPTLLLAGAGDSPDASIVTTGPIGIEVDAKKTPIPKEAVYYLNYSRGTLLAAVPFERQTAGSRQVLSDFAERDLVADFGLTPGRSYHFTMTTASTGAMNGGVAPLYVFETTTGQMAIYQVKLRFSAMTPISSAMTPSRPAFELLERRPDPRLARAGVPAATTSAR